MDWSAELAGYSDTKLDGMHVSMGERMRSIERRDWWLWICAVFTTLLLTAGIVSFGLPSLHGRHSEISGAPLNDVILGLVGMVLLFDIYTVYQHFQIQLFRTHLIEQEELFRLISENAADMIAVVDTSGKRLYNSPSYEKILGYSLLELDQTGSFEQIHPEDREKVQKAAMEAQCTGLGTSLEYRMRHKDGSWRTLESKASAVFKHGHVERLVIVIRDVTERKRLEEQFRQAQKMEAIGRLSGGVAHDFNNLLGVIIGYGEVLQDGISPEAPMRSCIEEMLKAAHRAANLTRQLLAFSRQQVMDPRILDLNVVVRDMEKMLKRLIGEDVHLITHLDRALGYIKADVGQIEQVVMNLAVNARDAMPIGGELVIETSNYEVEADFARRYSYPMSLGKYVLLTFRDTGVGMDAATRSRIFEPFFTTKEKGKGTGLGLSMVYGVVKQSGGYIDVQSEPGQGTTFKILLPAAEESIGTRPYLPEASLLKGNETVLLVEDEMALRKLTRHLLELVGYTVLEAEGGIEALKISRDYEAHIDLLLTDVVMPAMSGRVVADELLKHRPDTHVLFMSGYTGQTVGQHGVLAEGSFYLSKPFTREALTSKVREALDGRHVLVSAD